MSCRYLGRAGRPAPFHHRLWCPECRAAYRADRVIALAMACLRAQPAPAEGLAATLRALGGNPMTGFPSHSVWRRLVRRKLRALLGVLAAAFALGEGWLWWIERDPGVVVPTPATPAVDAFWPLSAAGRSIKDSNRIGQALSDRQPSSRASAMQKSAASAAASQSSDPASQEVTPAEQAKLVAENAGPLRVLRQNLAVPYLEPPARSFAALFPHYADYRSLARLLVLEAQVRESRGDLAGAMSSALDAIQLGRHIQHGGVLIGKLVGIACEAMGRSTAWRLAGRLTGPEAREASLRLESIRNERVTMADTLEEEKRLGTAGLLELMRRRGWRFGVMAMYGSDRAEMGLWAGVSSFIALLPYSKRTIVQNYRDAMDWTIRRSRLPYPLKHTYTPPPLPSDPINQLLTPSFTGADFGDALNETENALLEVTLALRAYHGDHGRYPASLAALTPRYLRQPPADPFGQDTLLLYRCTGDRYVLYSVGPDGSDDGGKPIVNEQVSNAASRYEVFEGSVGDIVAGTNK